jgi:hypothetical protein
LQQQQLFTLILRVVMRVLLGASIVAQYFIAVDGGDGSRPNLSLQQ